MELPSDLTSESKEETLTDKSKYVTDTLDSSSFNTMKHKDIPNTESDRIEPLTNGLDKSSDDTELPDDCTPPEENSTEAFDSQEIQHEVSCKNDEALDNQETSHDAQSKNDEALDNQENQHDVLSKKDESLDGQNGPHDTPNKNDDQEQCQKDMDCDSSRDSISSSSNSNCQCSNPEGESQINVPASPGSSESLNEYPDASKFDEIINVDLRRTRRSSKRKKDSDLCCPVCGLTIRLPELESHFNQEVEKLSKIPKTQRKTNRDDSGINTTYVQVRSNRLNRLTAKVTQYAEKAKGEVKCPVCKLWIYGSEEEMNNHVALCFQNDESDEPINVEDDEDDNESFGEYEFGDETRIRAISLVPGGYRSLQGQNVKRPRVEEDEDLDVDVDDTIAFGQPQYSELDVILNKNGEDKASDQLRKAVLVDPSIRPQILESRKWSTSEDIFDAPGNSSESPEAFSEDKNDDKQSAAEQKDTVSDHIISSLKEKIKDLGDQSKNVKCLICMEPYTKPVVSTTCWHVYCEECWLMTMGVKKLCPQCNMIVFPTDLRRIYL